MFPFFQCFGPDQEEHGFYTSQDLRHPAEDIFVIVNSELRTERLIAS
jgi:hypothetical protein